jgi:hypothetical protein
MLPAQATNAGLQFIAWQSRHACDIESVSHCVRQFMIVHCVAVS